MSFELALERIQAVCSTICFRYTGWPKKFGTIFFLYALTLPTFSKLFHCQNQEKICNNTVAKDPTTPQVRHYTTLLNVSVMKQQLKTRRLL